MIALHFSSQYEELKKSFDQYMKAVNSPTVITAQLALVDTLEMTCTALCMGDEKYLREIRTSELLSLIVRILANSNHFIPIEVFTFRCLALLASVVPRGGLEIGRKANEVVPFFRKFLSDISPLIENDDLCEELLQCVYYSALYCHVAFVKENIANLLISLNPLLSIFHLKELCLKSIKCIFETSRKEEGAAMMVAAEALALGALENLNMIYGVSNNSFVSNGDASSISKERQKKVEVTKEDITLIELNCGCFSQIIDRVLIDQATLKKSSHLLELFTLYAQRVLENCSRVPPYQTTLILAGCSIFLSIFLTDPQIGKIFTISNNVLPIICGIILSSLNSPTDALKAEAAPTEVPPENAQLNDDGANNTEATDTAATRDASANILGDDDADAALPEMDDITHMPMDELHPLDDSNDTRVAGSGAHNQSSGDFGPGTGGDNSNSNNNANNNDNGENQGNANDADNGAAGGVARQLLSDDATTVPLISDELNIVPLLEFLLVIFPNARAPFANADGLNATLPFYNWIWEDDFHNVGDCAESLSTRLDLEYCHERSLGAKWSTSHQIQHINAKKPLIINFQNKVFQTGQNKFSHAFKRDGVVSGYIHVRNEGLEDNCICKEKNASCDDDNGNNNKKGGSNDNDRDVEDALFADPFDENINGKRSGMCCGKGGVAKKNRGLNVKGTTHSKTSLVTDSRIRLLHSDATREVFLSDDILEVILSNCIPVFITTAKNTVNSLVARHLSTLLLRALSLSIEFCYGKKYMERYMDAIKDGKGSFKKVTCSKKGKVVEEKLKVQSNALSSVLTYFFLARTNTVNETQRFFGTARPFKVLGEDVHLKEMIESWGISAPEFQSFYYTIAGEICVNAIDGILLLKLFTNTSHCSSFSNSQLELIETVANERYTTIDGFKNDQTMVLCTILDSTKEVKKRKVRLSAKGGCTYHHLAPDMWTLTCRALSRLIQSVRGEAVVPGEVRKETIPSPLGSNASLKCVPKDKIAHAQMNEEAGNPFTTGRAGDDYPSEYLQPEKEKKGKHKKGSKSSSSHQSSPKKPDQVDLNNTSANSDTSSSKWTLRLQKRMSTVEDTPSPELRGIFALYDELKESDMDFRSLSASCPDILNEISAQLERWLQPRLRERVYEDIVGGPIMISNKKGLKSVSDSLTLEHLKKLNYLLTELNRTVGESLGLVQMSQVFPSMLSEFSGKYKRRYRKNRSFNTVEELMWQPLMIKFNRFSSTKTDSNKDTAYIVSKAKNEICIKGKVYKYIPYADFEYSLFATSFANMGFLSTIFSMLVRRLPLETPAVSASEDQTGKGLSATESKSTVSPDEDKANAFIEPHQILFFINGVPLFNHQTSMLEALFALSDSGELLRTLVSQTPEDNHLSDLLNHNGEGFDSEYQFLAALRESLFFRMRHTVEFIVVEKSILEASVHPTPKCGCVAECCAPQTGVRRKVNGIESYCSPIHLFLNVKDEVTAHNPTFRLLESLTLAVHEGYRDKNQALSPKSRYSNTSKGSFSLAAPDAEQRRFSSALVHDLFSQNSAFLLPPLMSFTFTDLFYNHSVEGHLASFAVWNYPQIFPFEMRVTLLEMSLSSRRRISARVMKLMKTFKKKDIRARFLGLNWLGRENLSETSNRLLVTVDRENILDSMFAIKFFSCCPFALDITFKGEKGVGPGPALEFFELVAMKLASPELGLFRTTEVVQRDGSVTKETNSLLFPQLLTTDAEQLTYFEILGYLLGRLLLLQRTTVLRFHPLLLAALRYDDTCASSLLRENMLLIDPVLEASLTKIEAMSAADLEAMDLVFTIDVDKTVVPLKPSGDSIKVTEKNVREYTKCVRKFHLGDNLNVVVDRIRVGLSMMINPLFFKLFSIEELDVLLSGPRGKLWETTADFAQDVTTSHGYHSRSTLILEFLELIPSWDAKLQRDFLKFVTGSSSLPLSGHLAAPITVVRRDAGAGSVTARVGPTSTTSVSSLSEGSPTNTSTGLVSNSSSPARIRVPSSQAKASPVASPARSRSHGHRKDSSGLDPLSAAADASSPNSRDARRRSQSSPNHPGSANTTTISNDQREVDNMLPTVSTCFNYLKLPSYSSKAVLEKQLKIAISEGQGTFMLT